MYNSKNIAKQHKGAIILFHSFSLSQHSVKFATDWLSQWVTEWLTAAVAVDVVCLFVVSFSSSCFVIVHIDMLQAVNQAFRSMA